MTDILPVNSFGDNGGGWGGGFGNRGGNCGGCGCGNTAAVADGFSTAILNDGVNAIQNSLNNVNMNLSSGLCDIGYQTLDQSSRTNLAMMEGFASLGRDKS